MSKLDKATLASINNLFSIEITNYSITLEELLMLPVEALKGVSAQVAEELTEIFRIRTIGDLLTKEVNVEQIRRATKRGISVGDLETWRFVAEKLYELEAFGRKEEKSVVLLGLRGSGKSTLVQLLKEDIGLQSLLNVAPEQDANQYELQAKNFNISLWNIGTKFVEKFMNRISVAYFQNVELILFVIDIQDSEKFRIVFNYLEKVLQMLKKLEQSPEFFVIFNKVDPEFMETPEFKENFDNIKPKITELLKQNAIEPQFFLSSVFNILGTKTAQEVRSIIDKVKEQKMKPEDESSLEEKFTELYAVVDNMFDLVLKLTNSITSRLEALEERVGLTDDFFLKAKIPQNKPDGGLLIPNEPSAITEPIKYDPTKTGLGPVKAQKPTEKSELINEMKKILALKRIE